MLRWRRIPKRGDSPACKAGTINYIFAHQRLSARRIKEVHVDQPPMHSGKQALFLTENENS